MRVTLDDQKITLRMPLRRRAPHANPKQLQLPLILQREFLIRRQSFDFHS